MTKSNNKLTNLLEVSIRAPAPSDGVPVFDLINQSPPLDVNSIYCYLLKCTHFASTSAVAQYGDEIIGFISGYILPNNENTLFVWQVAVDKRARGLGLATALLNNILDRSRNTKICNLETSITETNEASWALFKSISKARGGKLEKSTMFSQSSHFNGKHSTEYLAKIKL